MKAKINFTATVVGDHPNIVKFIGAVVNDAGSKTSNIVHPYFLIYTCSNLGTDR